MMVRAPNIRFADAAHLSEHQRALVLSSQKVRNFLEGAAASFDMPGGTVRDVVWFDEARTKVGFVLFEADEATRTSDGHPIPGRVAMIRGDAVAVLPILVDGNGDEWTVLVRQPRLAAGDDAFEEIPAGMVDEGVFRSAAIRESEEEVGADLRIEESDLVLLREFMPSPGGSDERVRVYSARKEVQSSLIEALRNRRAGAEEEGERILVDVIPLAELGTRASLDAKATIAYFVHMARRGLVAHPGTDAAEPEAAAPVPRGR